MNSEGFKVVAPIQIASLRVAAETRADDGSTVRDVFTLVGIMVMLAILSAWRVIGGTLLTLLALAGVMAAVETMGVLTTLLLVIAVGAWRIASVLHTASHTAPTARS